MADSPSSPEVGQSILAGGIATNYLSTGAGRPLVLVHGSGPGVTAFANWRLVLPRLAPIASIYAPDVVGFGYTERPAGFAYTMDAWIGHLMGFLDALKLDQVDLVGNSFGGSLAAAAAVRYPDRFRRIVLMGPVVVPFPITNGLDAVWGYEPTREAMAKVMEYFAFNPSLITPDIVESRFNASLRPGYQDSFAAMFPAPRQRHVDRLATAPDLLKKMPHEVLIVHGREDQVIPVEASWRLSQLIPKSRLHVFSECGHWTQIEKCEPFCRLVADFLSE